MGKVALEVAANLNATLKVEDPKIVNAYPVSVIKMYNSCHGYRHVGHTHSSSRLINVDMKILKTTKSIWKRNPEGTLGSKVSIIEY